MNPVNFVSRLATYLPNYSKIDKKNRSIFGSIPVTVLCSAGFTCIGEQVRCSSCDLEPDLANVLGDINKANVSIAFVLIILHLKNECEMAISSLESFLSVNPSYHIAYENIVKQSRLNETEIEILDTKYETDGGHKFVQPQKIYDNLDFETLAKRCKDKTNMRSAEARLLSFKNWKYSHIVTPLALSHDGFYKFESKQNDDSVRCVYCGQILHQWEETDIVSEEHITNSPNCPLKTASRLSAEEPFNETEVFYHRCILMFTDENFKKLVIASKAKKQMAGIVKMFAEKKDFRMLTNHAVCKTLETDISFPSDMEKGAVGGRALQFDEPRQSRGKNASLTSTSDKKSRIEIEKMPIAEIQKEILKTSEENLKLRESKLCKICIDKDIDTVFLPCGHLVSCRGCAPKIRNCAVCRTLIRGTVLAFIPND